MTTSVKTELNNYTLDTEIGRGDLTIVYEGHRKSDGATVAIKVVAPQFMFDDYFVRRFLDMSKQAAKLEHPNIVRTYEAQLENDTLFIVREFAQARPLAQVLDEEGAFGTQRMLNVARQIAAALDYAHQKSIMHGDLSANRVFLDKDDNVLVADFGQNQALVGTSLVKQGFAVGSPEITAPERVHGQGPSRQSDLYSLGILCYQMLNEDPPFTGEPAAVLHAQAYEQPSPLNVVNPAVSIQVSETIGRMLAKGMEIRYATGAEYVRALNAAAQGSTPVRTKTGSMGIIQPVAGAEPPKPVWQRTWLWALVAIPLIIILLAIGFLAVSVWMFFRPASTEVAPSEPNTQPAVVAITPTPTQQANVNPAPDQQVEATAIPVDTSAATSLTTPPSLPTNPPLPTASPTPISLPTPGPPTVAEGSPFTKLQLAHGISADNQPLNIGASFAPGAQPIYLFFDYSNIEGGTTWTHRWVWGDTELESYDDVWPESFYDTGTAWVYFSPTGGFQPGPYQVTLEVDGRTVATATFVVQPGGI